jgi:hypothetical protein
VPSGAGFAPEEDTGENESFGVRKKMISLKVKLEMIFKIACLLVEAR